MYSGSMAERAVAGRLGVLQRTLAPGEPEDRGDRELHAGVRRAPASLDLLRHGHALVDVGERLLVARLEAEVEELDAAFAQRRQFLDGLAQQVARVRVAAHALEVGERAVQEVEDRVELARAEGHGVAVGEEDAAHALAHADRQPGDVLDDLVERAHRERLVQVRAAEVAGVVGAAVGDLDDQAVGLARRADDCAVVPHALDASMGARAARPGGLAARALVHHCATMCACGRQCGRLIYSPHVLREGVGGASGRARSGSFTPPACGVIARLPHPPYLVAREQS